MTSKPTSLDRQPINIRQIWNICSRFITKTWFRFEILKTHSFNFQTWVEIN